MVHFITATLYLLTVYKFFCEIEAYVKDWRATSIISFVGMNSMIIYLSHVIFSASLRIALFKIGVTDFPLHLVAGVSAGVIAPLVAIPLTMPAYKRWPHFTQALLPVKFPVK